MRIIFLSISWLAIAAIIGCDDLNDEESGSSDGAAECEKGSPTASPEPTDKTQGEEKPVDSDDQAGEAEAGVGESSQFPFNRAALTVDTTEEEDKKPAGDPCATPTPKPDPAPEPTSMPLPLPKECQDLSLSAIDEEPDVTKDIPELCASTSATPKNIAPKGEDKKIGLKWQVQASLKTFAEAHKACSDLGAEWRIGNRSELTKLFQISEIIKREETACTTNFWAGPVSTTHGIETGDISCSAATVGFAFIRQNPDSLPINAQFERKLLSARSTINAKHSVICIADTTPPAIPCAKRAVRTLQEHPQGIVDAKTKLTWARITVGKFSRVEDVEAQCALGAKEGWRLPTAAEVKAAVANNVFTTTAYPNGASCPRVWHSDSAGRTCSYLGVVEDDVYLQKTKSFPVEIAFQCDNRAVALCVKD